MKIYTVEIDISLALPRLKKFDLKEFNSAFPVVFVEASDPDGACYEAVCKFMEILLKQQESKTTAYLIKDIMQDFKVTKVYCKDEKKL